MTMHATTPLGEVCDLVRGPFGGSLKKEIFQPKGYAVYEQQHAIYNQFSEIRYFVSEAKFKEMQRFKLRPGDLIMSCSGTIGKVAIVPSDAAEGIINQALLKITPSPEVDVNYLKHWMESSHFENQLKSLSFGAAIKNVASVKFLKNSSVPLPSLEKQRRIAAILDQADALRRLRQSAIDRLNTLGQAIFYEMFGDSDDFNPQPLEAVADLRRGPFGGALKKEIFVENGYQVYEQSHAISKNCSKGRYFIKERKYREMEAFSVKPDDLLVSCSGTLGRVIRLPKNAPPGVINQALLRIRPNTRRVLSEYLEAFFETPQMSRFLTGFSRGTGLQNFPPMGEVRKIPVPVPSIKQQEALLEHLSKISIETRKLDLSAEKLRVLFDSIQARAFQREL